MSRLVFELIDIVQLARPNLHRISIDETAAEIAAYKRGGHRSYDAVFNDMKVITAGLATEDLLRARFAKEKNESWRKACEDLAKYLLEVFGKEGGTWYDIGRKPIETLPGVWFKPAIRGVWAGPRGVLATLVNPRKNLYLTPLDLSFLLCGVNELHVRDQPSISGALLVDFGLNPITDRRVARTFFPGSVAPMPLDRFESVVLDFMRAIAAAGYTSAPAPAKSMTDLFRRR